MRRPDFAQALRQADAERRSLGVPPDSRSRVRARLRRPQRRRARSVVLGIAFGLAASATIALLMLARPEQTPLAPAPTSDVSSTVRGLDLGLLAVGEGVSLSSPSDPLEDSSLEMRLDVPSGQFAVLQRERQGLRLVEGTVRVDVRIHRDRARRILVSHGVIEVTGTRFTVVQRADDGEVVLHEGSITFRDAAGGIRYLLPGDRHTWPGPLSSVTEPVLQSAGPVTAPRLTAPRPQARPGAVVATARVEAPLPLETAALLDRVARLRSLARFEDAAKELEAAIDAAPRRDIRELLRYELASILTHQLRTQERACTQWRTLLREASRGRFSEAARRAMATCPPGAVP